jgi:hypothetical protein
MRWLSEADMRTRADRGDCANHAMTKPIRRDNIEIGRGDYIFKSSRFRKPRRKIASATTYQLREERAYSIRP